MENSHRTIGYVRLVPGEGSADLERHQLVIAAYRVAKDLPPWFGDTAGTSILHDLPSTPKWNYFWSRSGARQLKALRRGDVLIFYRPWTCARRREMLGIMEKFLAAGVRVCWCGDIEIDFVADPSSSIFMRIWRLFEKFSNRRTFTINPKRIYLDEKTD